MKPQDRSKPFEARPSAGKSNPQAEGCCPPVRQASCCGPQDKTACCDKAGSNSCGCQHA
jgi:hypothetical protein